MIDLRDKTAIVTGSASGIGFAVAESLCAAGARVALNYLPDDDRGPAAVNKLSAIGAQVIAAPGDVSLPDVAEATINRAIADLGRLDYLVNNAGTAGGPEPVPFAELDRMTDAFWSDILSTNLVGPFRCTKAAAAALRERRGAVVNTASVAGLGIRGSSIAYAASKAALINLTTSLARALAPDVRVNAVAPGLVDSPWIQSWSHDRREATRSGSLLGKICQPQDIADVIVFLCAGTQMVNAQTIIIDGGRT